jgi:hypothetical protein
MARFRLAASHVFGRVKLKAGSVIVDTVGNQQPGDFLWTPLSSTTLSSAVTPIDASATTMKAASRFAGMPDKTMITGAESID